MEAPHILVVDDEETVRQALVRVLKKKGCVVLDAGSAERAVEIVQSREPDVALLDIVLPGKNGLALAEEIKSGWPDCEIIMITSQGSVGTAVEAIRKGAYDYLSKPFESLDEVWDVVRRALAKREAAVTERSSLETRERLTGELRTALTRLADPENGTLVRSGGNKTPTGKS